MKGFMLIFCSLLIAFGATAQSKLGSQTPKKSIFITSILLVLMTLVSCSVGYKNDGYDVDTNPRQRKLEKQGRLIKFTDVVSPWNLTSFVFKNIFSMHVVGQKGEWCDYPMFPELMRKAGYHVTFITNQFLSQAKANS